MAEPTENLELNGENNGSAAGQERRQRFFKLHPSAKWVLLVIGLVIVVGGIFVWHHYSTHETTDDAQIDGDIYPISSRIRGHVVAVEVENNEFVKKGTVLVRIDPTDYQVALERAQADYARPPAVAYLSLRSILQAAFRQPRPGWNKLRRASLRRKSNIWRPIPESNRRRRITHEPSRTWRDTHNSSRRTKSPNSSTIMRCRQPWLILQQ